MTSRANLFLYRGQQMAFSFPIVSISYLQGTVNEHSYVLIEWYIEVWWGPIYFGLPQNGQPSIHLFIFPHKTIKYVETSFSNDRNICSLPFPYEFCLLPHGRGVLLY